MDLAKLSPSELKNLLANNAKHGQAETVRAVLIEMQRRGIARSGDYKHLTWNQEAVQKALAPFVAVAASVPDNQRTTYTQAGGLRIGRSRNDPEWFWIDTYSAIKTRRINALIVCYIKRPGDEPTFQFHVDGAVVKSFNADGLEGALGMWRAMAAEAVEA